MNERKCTAVQIGKRNLFPKECLSIRETLTDEQTSPQTMHTCLSGGTPWAADATLSGKSQDHAHNATINRLQPPPTLLTVG